MIPKKIYYCWFGGKPLPKLAKKCIKSWKKFLPDYEIIECNENNFDLNCCDYVREAYDNKKYAFVTDYVRLYMLYKEGGIYMDTDVEVLKNLDCFLNEKAFSGFENEKYVPTGLMASEKGNEIIGELLNYYDNKKFVNADGTLNLKTNTEIITEIMLSKGLKLNNKKQCIEGFMLYPNDYFCPLDHNTKKLYKTKNTYAIHWFSGSWVPKSQKIKIKLYNGLKKIFGEKILNRIRKKESN